MTRVRRALRRLVKWLAGTEDPPPTRLSEDEAIGLAGAAAERAGLGGFNDLHEPIAASARREGDAGPIVWTVMTNADCRGGHVRVKIDDATGEAIELHVLPR